MKFSETSLLSTCFTGISPALWDRFINSPHFFFIININNTPHSLPWDRGLKTHSRNKLRWQTESIIQWGWGSTMASSSFSCPFPIWFPAPFKAVCLTHEVPQLAGWLTHPQPPLPVPPSPWLGAGWSIRLSCGDGCSSCWTTQMQSTDARGERGRENILNTSLSGRK